MNERVGAVDRINNPATPRGALLLALFFTQDGIVWKDLLDRLAQVSFRFTIRYGDKRIVSLAGRRQSSFEVPFGNRPCFTRQLYRKLQQLTKFLAVDRHRAILLLELSSSCTCS